MTADRGEESSSHAAIFANDAGDIIEVLGGAYSNAGEIFPESGPWHLLLRTSRSISTFDSQANEGGLRIQMKG